MLAIGVALVICGLLTACIAGSKGQPFGTYFFLGALLGPIGLLIAITSSRTPEFEARRQHEVEQARQNLS